MTNLLTAGFHRLLRDKIFWIGILVVLAISTFLMVIGNIVTFSANPDPTSRTLDDYYFTMAPYIGFFCAVFVSLFIGTEHSEGAMRNKIIVGRTRTQVYLSNYVVCLIAGECFAAAWLISGLVGIPSPGHWQMGLSEILIYAVVAVFFVAAFMAIFTLLCMLSTNKAITVVIALSLTFILVIAAAMINSALSEPEMHVAWWRTTAEGVYQQADPVPNPNYIGGTAREILRFIVDFLPSGQGILMFGQQIARPVLSILSSIGITLGTIFAGIVLFKRKDLK